MAEVGDIFPGTNEKIVAKIPVPGKPGAYWLQGEMGGVFTEGTDAPFYGSYFSPEMEANRNDPNRRFSGIEATAGGGYRSISTTPGELGYQFGPLSPAETGTTPLPGTPGSTDIPTDADGKALFIESLVSSGFSRSAATSLADSLWTRSKTLSKSELWIELRKTPEYQERFGPLIDLRERAAGGEYIPYIPTEAEMVEIEAGIRAELIKAGLPSTFYDQPSDFARFITGGVSVAEVATRISYGQRAALGTDPTLREELGRQFDVGLGDLTAIMLDPDIGTDIVTQRFTQAQIGAASRRQGFGTLTEGEIADLYALGLTPDQAESRFGAVSEFDPLFQETAEEGTDLGRTEQLGFVAGQAPSISAVEQRLRQRQARFAGGGGASGIGGRESGLGTAQ